MTSPFSCKVYIGSSMAQKQWVHTHYQWRLVNQSPTSPGDWPWCPSVVSRMFKHISFIHQINSNIAISTHLHLTSFSTHYKTCVNQKIIYLIRSIYFLKSNLFHQTSLLLSLSRFLFLLNKYDIIIFFPVISNLYYFIHFIWYTNNYRKSS